MNIAANFFSVRNQDLIDQLEKKIAFEDVAG
jgi:hypothetical protein